MPFIMHDAVNTLSLDPEYDYEFRDEQIRDEHVTRAGQRYVYRWSNRRLLRFSLRFLSQAQRDQINSWWAGNARLTVVTVASESFSSAQLVDDNVPVSRQEKPYADLFRGRLELDLGAY